MESLIRFLKIDATIQKILLFLSCLCIIFIFFIGLPLILLGVWQLISAIVVWSKLRDQKRKNYLIFCFFYIGMMALLAMEVANFSSSGVATFILFIVFILFPIIMAFGYLSLTNRTIKLLENGNIIEYHRSELENILDADEILGKQNIKL